MPSQHANMHGKGPHQHAYRLSSIIKHAKMHGKGTHQYANMHEKRLGSIIKYSKVYVFKKFSSYIINLKFSFIKLNIFLKSSYIIDL